MQILDGVKLDFEDVLLCPRRTLATSRKDINLFREFRFYHSPYNLKCIPIIVANMSSVGTIEAARTVTKYGMMCALHKYYDIDTIINFYHECKERRVLDKVWFSFGIRDKDFDKAVLFNNSLKDEKYSPNLVLDSANGHMDKFCITCSKYRDLFKDSIICAGNVVIQEMTSELILHGGVDIVKIGLGSGSACLSRSIAGTGYPQLSACLENSAIAHGLKNGDKKLGLITSDGGIKQIGDIAKAIAVGSDIVMIGGMFSGYLENAGEWVLDEQGNKKSIKFYGMSSYYAQELFDEVKDYTASEGEVKEVNYKGSMEVIIKEILGGLRSACSYSGASSLRDLSKCAALVRINRIK